MLLVMSTAGVDAYEQHLCRLGCVKQRRDLRKAALLCGKHKSKILEWVLLSLFIRRARLDVPYVGVLDCFLCQVSSGWFACVPVNHVMPLDAPHVMATSGNRYRWNFDEAWRSGSDQLLVRVGELTC